MSSDEFAAYRTYVASEGNHDHNACRGTDHLLPDGPATKNQHLLTIRGDQGECVGMAWLMVNKRQPTREAFVVDFVIYPAHRRHGYAKDAIAAVEAYATRLGLPQIAISVSPDNLPARSLCELAGFRPVFTRMTKQLCPKPRSVPASERENHPDRRGSSARTPSPSQ